MYGLPFIELDKATQFFHAQDSFRQRKPCAQFFGKTHPAFAFSPDNGNKRGGYVRCLLIHVQDSRHDILLAEHVGEVFQIVERKIPN